MAYKSIDEETAKGLTTVSCDGIQRSYSVRKLEDGSKYDNLYLAAKARSESDWLVGINGMNLRNRLLEINPDANIT